MNNLVNRLRFMARNNPDYVGAVFTGYLFIGLNVGLQIFLVPLYLAKLGYVQFGVLMILFSFVNFTTVGVYSFASSVLRVLGEQSVAGDAQAFADTYSISRIILLGYGMVLMIGMMIIIFWHGPTIIGVLGDQNVTDVTPALLLTAVYLLVLFELSLNRVALNASGRQTAGNLIQLVQYAVFGITVVPSLLFGVPLWGVIACLLFGSVVARFCSWIYWHRSALAPVRFAWRRGIAQSLLKRFLGRSGLAFFVYTVLCFFMQADVLIVGWLAGAEAAASFVLVWKIAEVILQVLGRIPEHLQVEFIHMDAQGHGQRLLRVYREGLKWVRLSALVAGVSYAVLGHWLVRLWVGPQHTPNTEWGYWLAGAAIVWYGSARLPAVMAYARVRMKPLLIVAGTEWVCKLVLMILLFPTVGYVAPLVAISIVHVGGAAIAYAQLGRRVSDMPR